MLLGGLDLFKILRSGRAGIKQSGGQKDGQQHTQKSPTHRHRVSVPNERHGMALISISLESLISVSAHQATMTAGYFSVTSGISINSHLFASVIHASRMRAKYSRS